MSAGRAPLWPAYVATYRLGGYGTTLSAGLGIGPFIAGGVSEVGGFGWGFGVVGVVGLVIAVVAAVVLAGTRRRPAVVGTN